MCFALRERRFLIDGRLHDLPICEMHHNREIRAEDYASRCLWVGIAETLLPFILSFRRIVRPSGHPACSPQISADSHALEAYKRWLLWRYFSYSHHFSLIPRAINRLERSSSNMHVPLGPGVRKLHQSFRHVSLPAKVWNSLRTALSPASRMLKVGFHQMSFC
jgi:hypothetical protein